MTAFKEVDQLSCSSQKYVVYLNCPDYIIRLETIKTLENYPQEDPARNSSGETYVYFQ